MSIAPLQGIFAVNGPLLQRSVWSYRPCKFFFLGKKEIIKEMNAVSGNDRQVPLHTNALVLP